jgi:hypothetical protein
MGPGSPYESANDNDHVGKGNPEVDHSPFPLGTPEELLVSVAPGIGVLDHPAFRSSKRSGFALLGDHAHQAKALQKLSGNLRVVGAVEM